MRKIRSLFLFLLAVSGSLYGQAPEAISYQAVVRDAAGKLQENKPVEIQISILQGDANGMAVYRETHASMTNVNGLITLQIGTGVAIDGAFSAIDWSNGPYFVKTEIDLSGTGAGYSLTSVAQLLSVPFALYAKTAGKSRKPDWNATTGNDAEILNKPALFSGDYNDLTNKPQGTSTGDILYWQNNAWAILPIGLEGQMLTVADGKLAWIDPSFANTNASTYRVGDLYLNADGTPGGLVVELSTTGRYAKIIALTETELAWDPLAVKDSIYAEDGSLNPDYTGEMPETTGANSDTDGYGNTNTIKGLPNWTTKYPAFAYCATLTGDGWYLPSSNELQWIYENKDAFNTQLAGIAGAQSLDADFYWSSTELNSLFAYGTAFKNFNYPLDPDRPTKQEGEEDFLPIIAGTTIEEYKSVARVVRPLRRLSWAEATSKPVEKIYAIGDLFFENQNATGIVYEISQGGVHGKVLSLTEDTKVWATTNTEIGAVSGEDGLINQAALLDEADLSPFEAFNSCSALGNGWYLPSQGELFLIHSQRETVNAFLQNKFPSAPQLTAGAYWSSTEKDASTAYSFDFSGGTTEETTKNTSLKVRAIRTF